MLTTRVMHGDHDTSRTTARGPEEAHGAVFLGVLTFLKPTYRIAVTPRTGALAVQVAPRAVEVEPLKETVAARH